MRAVIVLGVLMLVLAGVAIATDAPDPTGLVIDEPNVTEPVPAGSVPLEAGHIVRADIVIE